MALVVRTTDFYHLSHHVGHHCSNLCYDIPTRKNGHANQVVACRWHICCPLVACFVPHYSATLDTLHKTKFSTLYYTDFVDATNLFRYSSKYHKSFVKSMLSVEAQRGVAKSIMRAYG